MAASTTVYTTYARMLIRAGQVGIDLRTDHDASSTEGVNEAIESASAEAEQYCWMYAPAALENSRTLGLWVTDMALYYLCTFRFNAAPGSAKALYDKAIEQLERVSREEMPLAGVQRGKSAGPSVTNFVVNQNHPARPIRVVKPTSTGTVDGFRENIDTNASAIDNG